MDLLEVYELIGKKANKNLNFFFNFYDFNFLKKLKEKLKKKVGIEEEKINKILIYNFINIDQVIYFLRREKLLNFFKKEEINFFINK